MKIAAYCLAALHAAVWGFLIFTGTDVLRDMLKYEYTVWAVVIVIVLPVVLMVVTTASILFLRPSAARFIAISAFSLFSAWFVLMCQLGFAGI